MKRLFISGLLTVYVVLVSLAQDVNITDSVFLYALIENGIDTDGDSLISISEAEAVSTLDVQRKNITSMTGIEAFVNLVSIICSDNLLTGLDVSGNTALEYLDCNNNPLTNLDVSNCTLIEHLECQGSSYKHGSIDSLNLAGCDALKYLNCSRNVLSEVDFSTNTALSDLICSHNQFENLDISHNRVLSELNCNNNQLTSLDIRNNDSLKVLYCWGNQLTSLDVSNNAVLVTLGCGNNQLTSLDVSNNPELEYLGCNNSLLTRLDISNNKAIKTLEIENIPDLFEVCVWIMPLPKSVRVSKFESPNAYLTAKCADLEPPELEVTDTLFQPEYIIAKSSEDGIIYLVPVNTKKDLVSIRNRHIDSLEAVADSILYFDLPKQDNGRYWLYARDSTGNISEPELVIIMGVWINNPEARQIRIYPNPSHDFLTVQTLVSEMYTVEIISLSGQTFHKFNFRGSRTMIDLSSLLKGVYFISIRSMEFTRTEKIIKL